MGMYRTLIRQLRCKRCGEEFWLVEQFKTGKDQMESYKHGDPAPDLPEGYASPTRVVPICVVCQRLRHIPEFQGLPAGDRAEVEKAARNAPAGEADFHWVDLGVALTLQQELREMPGRIETFRATGVWRKLESPTTCPAIDALVEVRGGIIRLVLRGNLSNQDFDDRRRHSAIWDTFLFARGDEQLWRWKYTWDRELPEVRLRYLKDAERELSCDPGFEAKAAASDEDRPAPIDRLAFWRWWEDAIAAGRVPEIPKVDI